jgi:hypothetical protein
MRTFRINYKLLSFIENFKSLESRKSYLGYILKLFTLFVEIPNKYCIKFP